MPLVTASQLAALRTYAYRGLETPFELYHKTRSEDVYGTSKITWTLVTTGLGWLRMMNRPKTDQQVGLIEGAEEVYRFHTSVDIVPANGDRVKIGSIFYEIHDVNSDDTIQVFRTLVLRRVE